MFCLCHAVPVPTHTYTQDITKKEKGGGQDESGEEDSAHTVSIGFLYLCS